MSIWLVASLALLVGGLGPCLVTAVTGSVLDRLAALNLAGVVACLFFVAFAQAVLRPAYVDLALVLAPLSFAGCLVFTRLLERPR